MSDRSTDALQAKIIEAIKDIPNVVVYAMNDNAKSKAITPDCISAEDCLVITDTFNSNTEEMARIRATSLITQCSFQRWLYDALNVQGKIDTELLDAISCNLAVMLANGLDFDANRHTFDALVDKYSAQLLPIVTSMHQEISKYNKAIAGLNKIGDGMNLPGLGDRFKL